MISALIGVLVFLATATLNYTDSRCTAATVRGDVAPAAAWALVAWGSAVIAFVVVVEGSLWYLAPEAAGVVAGKICGVRAVRGS